MSERRLVEIEITDWKAIDHLNIRAGSCTVLTGRNGLGKSSVLEAVQDIFDGGCNPPAIRGYNGAGGVPEAEKAVVSLKLDDGTTITKTTRRKGADLQVRTVDGGVVRGPKQYIEKLAKSFAFDPIAFCTAKASDRLRWVQEVMAITFTHDELAAIGIGSPSLSIDLERLNSIIDGRRAERTNENRRAKDAEGTHNSLKRSIPTDDGTDWAAKAAGLEDQIRDGEAGLASVRAEFEADAERRKSALRAESQEKLDALKAQIRNEELLLAESLRAVDARTADQADHTAGAGRVAVNNFKLELGTVRQKHEESIRIGEIKRQVETWGAKMAAAYTTAEQLTTQIAALEKLKQEKISALPVPGIDIRDTYNAKGEPSGKDIAVQGVIWDEVNTSEQMIVAIQIGFQGAGDLPLFICDHAGEFDDDRLKDLAERAKVAGIQLLMARAEPKPLTVEVLS